MPNMNNIEYDHAPEVAAKFTASRTGLQIERNIEMSDNVRLNPGETVIRTYGEVGYGGKFSRNNSELTLTTQALILRRKNLFGQVKDVIRFPLSDIVISNGQAQVKMGNIDLVTHSLDVYFTTGLERFRFTWEDDIKDWANDINSMLTGGPELYHKKSFLEEGADLLKFAENFDGAAKKFKKIFGIRSSEQLSRHCPSCGASITGREGETIKCPFCGGNYTFE